MTSTRDTRAYTRFRIFGTHVETSFPFETRLPTAGDPLDLRLDINPPERDGCRTPGRLVYTSPFRAPGGQPAGELYQAPPGLVLRLAGAGDFALEPARIQARLHEKPDLPFVENQILGVVLALWLECRGVLALHASSVVVNGGAIAFLGDSGQGKSTLAISLMEAGHPLLSDDILAVGVADNLVLARPSYPQLRLWPSEAARLVGTADHLQRVHPHEEKRRLPVGCGGFGQFQTDPTPLRCIYLAQRTPGLRRPEVTALSGSEALVEMVRFSFAARLVEAAGMQPERLPRLARLVSPGAGVAFRRLRYPSGFEHLPAVREAVQDAIAFL